MRAPLTLPLILCSCGSPTAATTACVSPSSASGGPVTATVVLLPDLVAMAVDVQPDAHVASPDDAISVSCAVWNRPAPPDEVDADGNVTHYVRLPAPAPSVTARLVDNGAGGALRPGPWEGLDALGPGRYAVVSLRCAAPIGSGTPRDVDGTVAIDVVPGVDRVTGQPVADADDTDNGVVLRLVWGAVAAPPFVVE